MSEKVKKGNFCFHFRILLSTVNKMMTVRPMPELNFVIITCTVIKRRLGKGQRRAKYEMRYNLGLGEGYEDAGRIE